MYTIELTKEERECIIDALMLFQVDADTTKQGQKLSNQVLDKICKNKNKEFDAHKTPVGMRIDKGLYD